MTEQPDIPPPPPAGRPTLKLPFELQSEEVVLLHARRHWLYLYGYLALVILAGIVGTIGVVLLVMSTLGFDGMAGKGIAIALIVWAVFWGVRGYFHWYRYHNDIWTVTNQRLVDSIKRHWFHHEMSSADLVDVQDMRVVREGFLQTALNFGDVRCQTAGEVPNFVLDGIPDPKNVLAVVDAARDAARRALRGTA